MSRHYTGEGSSSPSNFRGKHSAVLESCFPTPIHRNLITRLILQTGYSYAPITLQITFKQNVLTKQSAMYLPPIAMFSSQTAALDSEFHSMSISTQLEIYSLIFNLTLDLLVFQQRTYSSLFQANFHPSQMRLFLNLLHKNFKIMSMHIKYDLKSSTQLNCKLQPLSGYATH